MRRWLVLASPFGFMVSVVFENEVWRQRTRRFRAWLGVVGGPAAARLALDDLRAAVPAICTAANLKGWLLPHSPVPDGAAFYAASAMAGLPS